MADQQKENQEIWGEVKREAFKCLLVRLLPRWIVVVGFALLACVLLFKVSMQACGLIFFWAAFGFFEGHLRTMDCVKDMVNLKRH